MKHLLNISIGPVQEFIASARRCQDLWYGSWLLSELAKACAGGLLSHPRINEEAIIFPGGASRKMLEASSGSSVANKLLVVVDSPDRIEVEAAANTGWSAMMARLDQIRKQTFSRIEGEFDRERAKAQIEDLIEFQWVAVRFEEGGYPEARKTSERHLAAVKNTKTWGQPDKWAQDGRRKSSLDGVRESVLDDDLLKRLQKDPDQLYRLYRVRPSERLCGVGLLKRYGTEKEGRDPFHSTGHVAAGPLRHKLRNLPEERQRALRQLWTKYEVALESGCEASKIETGLALPHEHSVFGKSDAGLVFESRLEDLFPDKHDRKPVLDALQDFLRAADCTAPNPYYALLLADGDRMGKAIDACRTQEAHRAISQALDGFAQEVERIVEESHEGSLIYSGGDDVLALVPLHTCLPCARELKEAFHMALAGFPTEVGGSTTPTLSVGLGISHYLDDMADGLELARRAEKLAKQEPKNSLAILWQKRGGGEALTACDTWKSDFLKDLFLNIKIQQASELSRKLPFELENLARLLDGAEGDDHVAMLALAKADARRILGRKRQSGGNAEIGEDLYSSLGKRIDLIKNAEDLRRLANILQLAKEFARAYDQAGASPMEEPA